MLPWVKNNAMKLIIYMCGLFGNTTLTDISAYLLKNIMICF